MCKQLELSYIGTNGEVKLPLENWRYWDCLFGKMVHARKSDAFRRNLSCNACRKWAFWCHPQKQKYDLDFLRILKNTLFC